VEVALRCQDNWTGRSARPKAIRMTAPIVEIVKPDRLNPPMPPCPRKDKTNPPTMAPRIPKTTSVAKSWGWRKIIDASHPAIVPKVIQTRTLNYYHHPSEEGC
jgi:hypothetical protein